MYLVLLIAVFVAIILLGLLIGCLKGDSKEDEKFMDIKGIVQSRDPSKIIYLCVGNPFVYEAYDMLCEMLRDKGYEVIVLKYVGKP